MKHFLFAALLSLPVFSQAATDEKEKAAAAETTSSIPTVLQGTIGDVTNYQPLSEVRLVITASTSGISRTLTTDKNGKFRVEGLPAGTYQVRMEKDGYESSSYKSLTVREGSSNNFGFYLFQE